MTAVIFTAFDCDTCADAAGFPKQLEEKYGAKVRVVLKHKGVPILGPDTITAAEAALAAHAQGKYAEMAAKLYENRKSLDRASLERIAGEVGLDAAKFKAALDAGTYRGQVLRDALTANEIGAHSMPNFTANGARTQTPDKSYATLEKLVEQELEKAKAKLEGGAKGASFYDDLVKGGKFFEQLDPKVNTFDSTGAPFLGAADAKVVISVF